jgi:hypothetical protein
VQCMQNLRPTQVPSLPSFHILRTILLQKPPQTTSSRRARSTIFTTTSSTSTSRMYSCSVK